MIGDDASDDGHAHTQPESDAPRLSGEVRLHNLVNNSRVDTRTVIAHVDGNSLGR